MYPATRMLAALATPPRSPIADTNITDSSGLQNLIAPQCMVVGPVTADIGISKTLDTTAPFVAGDTLTYTLVVSNAGPGAATNVMVADSPTNLTITDVASTNCMALPCTIASLAGGASETITVMATIDIGGAFDNSATVVATETDPDPSNNTDDTGNGGTAAPGADVSMTKTLDTAGPFAAGQEVQYTLVVSNAGPDAATNVMVTDSPTNLTITDVSSTNCMALPCAITSLASGASETITVMATIDIGGAFDNSATVAAMEADPDSSDNTDDTGNGGTAEPGADVSMTKTLDTAGPFAAGQEVQYTLVVSNAGPDAATSVMVTDSPTNLTITDVASTSCVALPCTIASLASGASETITVMATIDSGGAFDNSATVAAMETDPDPSDNTDDADNGGTADAVANVSITKDLDTAGPFTAGDPIQYTLVVSNAGPDAATSVVVTDSPTNLTITDVASTSCVALPCTIASLASGASETITVMATIDSGGAFDNSATVAAMETDPDPSDNTDGTGNGGTAAPAADVSIVKTLDTAGPFENGQELQYTLVVSNAGPDAATNVLVADSPTSLTITGVVSTNCGSFPCTIPAVAAGGSETIVVTATIDSSGVFDNAASVSATEADPDETNNTDDSNNGGTAAPSADIAISKTLITDGPYSAGDIVQFTLELSNAGPDPAVNIVIEDVPTNLLITDVTGGGCTLLPCTVPFVG